MKEKLPRGVRNCNPGNIRISSVRYEGEVIPSQDSSFKQFRTMAYGYRAVFVLLDSYWRRGVRTLRAVFERYAPPTENHTDIYISFVSRRSGLDPSDEIDPCDRAMMTAVVSALSHYENGIAPDMSEVDEGWRLYMSCRR